MLCVLVIISVPSLCWDAMLSMTKVNLDLISDVDMYLVYEERMRGLVSYISKRCSNVNNKYLTL